MRRILRNPKLIGCLNCSPFPKIKLDKYRSCDLGFGTTELFKGKTSIWFYIRKDGDEERAPIVKDIEKIFKQKLLAKGASYLKFNTPLHDETYWFSKIDKEWYLVSQGQGFA